MANEQNLRTPTSEEARAMQLKGAKKRKENREKKILMSQIYADFLEKEYNVKAGEGTRKITGAELVNEVMRKVLVRGDSSSVSLLKELREGTEGNKVQLSGSVETKIQTTEERLKAFEDLMK